jgi:hypothetical protein
MSKKAKVAAFAAEAPSKGSFATYLSPHTVKASTDAGDIEIRGR